MMKKKRGLKVCSMFGGIWSFQKVLFLTVIVLAGLGFVGGVDAAPSIEFVGPTPSDGTNITNTSIEINISITESSLKEVKFNWNNINYTFYNDSLVLMFNFDNVSALGENDTYVVDVSKYGNNGTVVNATFNSSGGKYGGTFEFDGDGDYIDAGDGGSLPFKNETAWSITAWVYAENVTNSPAIITKAADSQQVKLLYKYANTRWQVQLWDGTELSYAIYTDATPTDKWIFLAAVYYGNETVDLYMDGDVGIPYSSSNPPNYENSANLLIGRSPHFNGTIDEVRIWNKSLTADEINKVYHSNLQKYSANKWNFYINQTNLILGNNNYFATASDSLGNENVTETRTITLLFKTTQYYDNRKMAVVWTGDDVGSGDINKHVNASNYAQSKKVVFSPAVITSYMDSSEWEALQTEVDEGFVSPVSHSVSHQYTPYDNTTHEVCYSKQQMEENLTLPWQNWFNGSEYMVGWVEPYSQYDSAVRGNLSECNYLADRGGIGTSNWASWGEDGLYKRHGARLSGDSNNLTTLNNNFSEVYSDGGIYHIYIHPTNHNWSETDKIPQHLDYIGNRTDVWYVGWGQLYMYHYLEDRIKPTINLTTYNSQIITTTMSVSGTERNKYGLSYPITYAFYLPNVWSNVFVFYKNTSNENYTLMTEKTRNEYWTGIEAYRTNLSENAVYVSKSFPQEYNEFYLKIVPILSTNFGGDTTDLTTANLLNITNLVLETLNYGKINFSESVNLSGGADLNTHVNVSHNYISINSTALSELNKSARLTLYNLTFTNPRILRDGEVCPSSICTEVSYVGGNFTFTVTSFSAYSAEETPTAEEETPSSGGGYPTFKPSQEQLEEGYEKSLRENWKIQFELNNETHAIKLDDIINKTAIITVSSEPITFNLTINETKKLNLDDDSYYDLQVFLKDISDYEADLIVKLIREEIPRICEPDWECSEWSGCINYTQTRICTDLNNCNTTEGKPDEVKSCCEPDWECSEWSECVNNIETRTCADLNECNVTEGRPDEVRECEPQTGYLNILIVSGLIVAVVALGFVVRKRI